MLKASLSNFTDGGFFRPRDSASVPRDSDSCLGNEFRVGHVRQGVVLRTIFTYGGPESGPVLVLVFTTKPSSVTAHLRKQYAAPVRIHGRTPYIGV